MEVYKQNLSPSFISLGMERPGETCVISPEERGSGKVDETHRGAERNLGTFSGPWHQPVRAVPRFWTGGLWDKPGSSQLPEALDGVEDGMIECKPRVGEEPLPIDADLV